MNFNEGWQVQKVGSPTSVPVTLPDDRMLYEPRHIDNPGAVHISYYGGGDYLYSKDFDLSFPEGGAVYLEFESIYAHPRVYLNGVLSCEREYGYTDFLFEATPYLKQGKNHIEVLAQNSDQPNSRWYSGSGIIRPVSLYVLPPFHLKPRSFRVRTLDYRKGRIEVSGVFSGEGKAELLLLDPKGRVVLSQAIEGGSFREEYELEDASLWSPEHPDLYQAQLRFSLEYQETVSFGIRQMSLDTEKGLLLNGKRVILYGACIHHDNGLLGARGDVDADKRKARLLRQNGFNAVRSAHNPISKAFLDEADRIGLLVLDEYADCWYIHKTMHDCACFVLNTWREDLRDMVEKDYNHPSVIMYSLGNEVAETSEEKGIRFVKEMTDYLHSLDEGRPVTCGVNIFFNALYSWGFGQYSDAKAKKEARGGKSRKRDSVGSKFFNDMAGILGAEFMKIGATLPRCDAKTKEAFAQLDVAGYNYGIRRYEKDLKRYPDRFILGTETFCADAGKFFALAQANPRVIGDFVWSGWDYLGEAGVGSWVALEKKGMKDDKANWTLAGSGRIDILGDPLAEMSYMQTAFRQSKIALAVVSPKDLRHGHSPSAWKKSWALHSYDFPGFEGEKAIAEIYSQEHEVALFQNGKLLKRIKKGKTISGSYSIQIRYRPGELLAVSYDEKGGETGRVSLRTAKEDTVFAAIPEKESLAVGETAFVHFLFQDEDGVVKPLENKEIEIISVDNGELLGLGNGCAHYTGTYTEGKTTSYYGRALGIFRPAGEGRMRILASSPYGNVELNIPVHA